MIKQNFKLSAPVLCWHLGGAADDRGEVDERVTGLHQFGDGDAAPLLDKMSHSIQLFWGDGDELPSVIYHT